MWVEKRSKGEREIEAFYGMNRMNNVENDDLNWIKQTNLKNPKNIK